MSDNQLIILECWVQGKRDSFCKMKADSKFEVVRWLFTALDNASKGDHIHIAVHDELEYMDG